MVAALTNHAVSRSTVENDIVAQLKKNEVNASKGIDLFPPNMSSSDSDKVAVMRKVHDKTIDAILTVSIIKQATESHYTGDVYAYNPLGNYYYYRDFWGYYSYWYPYFYAPTYYTEKVYYIETNLYDAKTEDLVWSVQSKTYDALELPAFSKDFAKTIVHKLKKDGIIISASDH